MVEAGKELGPYRIVAPLGAGGMGEVYKAIDSRLDRFVALKILPDHLAKAPEALARFQREAKALAALTHPNIVNIFDFAISEEIFFTVMELLEGETLRERLNNAPLGWQKTVEIGSAVADALHAAHTRGIVHRDLKPENIFLTVDGRIKVLDFGLARFESSLQGSNISAFPTTAKTNTGMVIGTVNYMSPEQVRGQTADARSDIFSLGCILYESITGQKPFFRPSAAETFVAILKEDPDFNEPAARPDLMRIIRYCLEKSPEERFQSARDLALALNMVLNASGLHESFLQQAFSQKQTKRRARKSIDSLAILPFVSSNVDPQLEYLSDGIIESVINTLSVLPKLRVMARSTVFRYKGKEVDPLQVGRELNVRAVVAGRIQQLEETLNISVELVDVLDGSQLWGERYVRNISDVLALQEQIAREISDKLRIRLAGEQKRRLAKRYTESTEAYKLYLQGRYYWSKRTEEGFKKGMEFFERAIQEDPNFALAYAGLADCYSLLGGYGFITPKEAYLKAKVQAMKALELDETLGEAHCSLAVVRYRYDWDWSGAEEEFKKSIVYTPSYPTARLWYGVFLVLMGRIDEGLQQIDRALELDPLSAAIHWTKTYCLYYARRYDDAIQQGRKTLELEPSLSRVHFDIGLAYVMKSMFEEGIQEIQRGITYSGETAPFLATLAYAYGVSGNEIEARKILERLLQESKTRVISPFALAIVNIALEDKDQAIYWLEKSFAEREDAVAGLRINPRLDTLRDDPRFIQLVEKLGLPQ